MEALTVAGAGVSGGVGGYSRLRRLVHSRTGMDLESYKERFIERRVAIRMRATGQRRFEDYLKVLARDSGEMERLLRCLTIHVSSFFRNADTFEAIRGEVLPRLFAPGAGRRPLFWSVGCSHGEEPYSLAILIHEHLGPALRRWDPLIEAIDVDDVVLERAKAAEFGWPQIADLAPARRERYFSREAPWRLVPEIRKMVRFHRRDILMEPPAGQYDCILCRNLLIYLDRRGQEAVLERMTRCLRPGGFMVLGRTEVFVGAGREAFEVVDARERIYRRTPADGAACVGGPAPAAAAARGEGT